MRASTGGGAILVDCVGKVFRDINRRQEVVALENLSLDVRQNEFVALLGPSGCGKSTLLNIVAGFETPTRGQILLDGTPITQPGPDRAVVFQDYALFPWLTVKGNLEFGMKNQRRSRSEREELVRTYTRLVRLEGFEDRYPRELSGGMRQRVALARVLVTTPRILLMDEPFGALDALTRHAMQRQLLDVWSVNRITVLFVTHSVEEALFLADRVVVLSGRPARILEILEMDEPRPRDISSESFNRKRDVALRLLEEEVFRGVESATA